MNVLVVAEHLEGRVRDVSRELIAAGSTIGQVTVAVIGADAAALALEMGLAGVEEIVTVITDTPEFDADTYRQTLAHLCEARSPDVVLLGTTANSISYGAALAVELNYGFASDVHAMRTEEGALVVTRSLYGGRVHAEIDFPGCAGVVLELRPSTWQPVSAPGSARHSSAEPLLSPSRTRHVAFTHAATASDVDLTRAEFILAVGRGAKDRDGVDELGALADRLGATFAVSRPIVDAGWAPASRQVGQSGQTVKPTVYLALGISGAVQHLAGMKDAGTIIAVNSDPNAAIFGVAHYGAVADLFDVAEELTKLS